MAIVPAVSERWVKYLIEKDWIHETADLAKETLMSCPGNYTIRTE
jgi:hypothetical protein